MVGLDRVVAHAISAGERPEPFFASGPQVQVVLEELAQEFEAVDLQASFELGVGEAGGLSAGQKVANGQITLVGGGERSVA